MADHETCTLTMEIRKGPALRAALDVLDLVRELDDLIPDWHEREKLELLRRAETLVDQVTAELHVVP